MNSMDPLKTKLRDAWAWCYIPVVPVLRVLRGSLRISGQLGLYSRPCSKAPFPSKQPRRLNNGLFYLDLLSSVIKWLCLQKQLACRKDAVRPPSFSAISTQLVSDTFQLSLLHSGVDWQSSGLKNRNKAWLLTDCVGRRGEREGKEKKDSKVSGCIQLWHEVKLFGLCLLMLILIFCNNFLYYRSLALLYL